MDPEIASNFRYHSKTAIFHFHDYGRESRLYHWYRFAKLEKKTILWVRKLSKTQNLHVIYTFFSGRALNPLKVLLSNPRRVKNVLKLRFIQPFQKPGAGVFADHAVKIT